METVLIVFICVGMPMLMIMSVTFGKKWLAFKERQLEREAEMTAEKAAQYAAKTERLEQRVATLERILTDRSTSLADEIEGLREKPLN